MALPEMETGRGTKPSPLCAQACPTLCDHTDCSPPGSSVRGILQARRLESVAVSFSWGSSQPGIKPGISCPGRRVLLTG